MEVDAALFVDGQGLVEQIHEHRLAAPDAAPEIHPAQAPGLAEQAEETIGGRLLESALQGGEALRSGFLLTVRAQLARFDERAVSAEKSAQTARSARSFLVSAMALAGLSPFGHTCAQFMIVWQR